MVIEEEQKSGKRIRRLLIIQSFVPLFLLLLIQHGKLSNFGLLCKFAADVVHFPGEAWKKVLQHTELFATLLMLFCIFAILSGFLIYVFFKGIQRDSYIDKAETIKVHEDTTGDGAVFFVSYILPLMMDDITQARGFACFIVILLMIVLLMRNTNLYYQNPILAIMGYQTFRFSFNETPYMFPPDQEFIAITRGRFDASKIVIRKKIADNVYLVYNKN